MKADRSIIRSVLHIDWSDLEFQIDEENDNRADGYDVHDFLVDHQDCIEDNFFYLDKRFIEDHCNDESNRVQRMVTTIYNTYSPYFKKAPIKIYLDGWTDNYNL